MFSSLMDESSIEMIPMISSDEEIHDEEYNESLPILPVKNTVLFPGVVIPITVGRERSTKLVKKAYKGDKIIGVVAQKIEGKDEPEITDLHKIGTVAKILKLLVLPDGNTTIIIQGKSRFELKGEVSNDPYLVASYEILKENFPKKLKKEQKALIQSLKDTALKIMQLNPEIPREAEVALQNIETPGFLTHFLSSNLNAEVKDKQNLLEINDGLERARVLLELMVKESKLLELKQEIQNKVNTDLNQQQRDYYIRNQIKVLQEELGQEGAEHEIEALRAKGEKKDWPDKVRDHFNKEVDKLYRMNPSAAEYPLSVNYVEYLVDLPWNEITKDNFNIKKARRVLDKDHFGLEKVKERILEYLSVLKLKNNLKAPIICLYGPPGVGKTSLGRSIATALNRQYVRMSLGGLHDEAEIRGHRKTYIGAMPGKVIQNIKKAGSSNPVFILDEIDKLGNDFRSDPSSAMLEVLDPEQNGSFMDNYLDLEYDLSKVLFIATANSLDTIQPALRDRMEIIEVTGYTVEEKVQIAKKYLIPRQVEEHGLEKDQLKISEKIIKKIIEDYTRESGVRNLERKVGAIARKVARKVAEEEVYESTISEADLSEYLGGQVFDKEALSNNDIAGLVTGLAWTQVGGEILTIESSLNLGKGKLTLSGQLGDVMKESAIAALSYLKSQANSLNIDHKIFDNFDLHIHVPAGAVPKDGPSAGITMFTSLVSLFTQRRVKKNIAMTGEITLTGRVLPVGGIKEKILAAKRAGVKEIILCSKNKKDLDEINSSYIKGLKIHYVDQAKDVIELALLQNKVPDAIPFKELMELSKQVVQTETK